MFCQIVIHRRQISKFNPGILEYGKIVGVYDDGRKVDISVIRNGKHKTTSVSSRNLSHILSPMKRGEDDAKNDDENI